MPSVQPIFTSSINSDRSASEGPSDDRPSARSSANRSKVLQHATVSERLFEVRLQCADVQQGLVDVTDDDARHAAVSLSVGDAASDSEGVRAACERGMEERAPAGHGLARSRSNCRRLTVHVSGTVWGVKHTLSSHAW